MAMKAMEAGALRMVPLMTGATSLSRVSNRASAPCVIKVRVSRGGTSSEWYLSGLGILPAASAVAEDGSKDVHNWLPSHNPWPLWFVKRMHGKEESNCESKDVGVRCVCTFQPQSEGGSEAFAGNFDMVVPVLTNTKALVEGEDLRVF